jgi:squalene-hopene/tetraprenyl-beta-curcumene cyclase
MYQEKNLSDLSRLGPVIRTAGVQEHAATLQGCAVEPEVEPAIGRACDWLLSRQRADGHWCETLEGDSILESEYVLLRAWLGQLDDPQTEAIAASLLPRQSPEGYWSQFPGGPIDVSASVKAYFALKLTGHDPNSRPMKRARRAILAAGGVRRVNSYTRYFLALLGQLDYRYCPCVPPEAVLLPKWFPINIYRISAWSRTILVPLSIVWAFRPQVEVPQAQRIDELFLDDPADWPPLRAPGLPVSNSRWSWENAFRWIDRQLHRLEAWRIMPLRGRAVNAARRWMTDHFVGSDGPGAIFPPIVWSRIALRCLGYADTSAEVRYCEEQLQALMWSADPDGVADRIQPCRSPVWDTAISLRALQASLPHVGNGLRLEPAIDRAIGWLLERQGNTPGDWNQSVSAEPGGWSFQYHNPFYPDVDDTVMVLKGLRQALSDQQPQIISQRLESPVDLYRTVDRFDALHAAADRGLAWTLAMQNRDGGWGAFDKGNDAEFLCHVPFADHNAMIDPSWPDITARVLECLTMWGSHPDHPALQRALRYLRQQQESDGCWFGRWGVNYIYGTWQVLVGLQAVGLTAEEPMVANGLNWLLKHQQPCGGWGESCASYDSPQLRGAGEVTASQTAWGVMGLLAGLPAEHAAVKRGIAWLLDNQQPDGTWKETQPTGTGFPRVFYMVYHGYRHYFPLLALGKYLSAVGGGQPISR